MTDYLELLDSLIKIKSYSGEEGDLRCFISDWFKRRNIKSFEKDGNLVVHIEGKNKNKAFIFNSHMDTVSQGDLGWKFGPWNPTKIQNKVIGLGASDMKSGLASSMLLAEKIKKESTPPVDLWFTYVTKEELDGSGTQNFAKWFVQDGYTKKYVDMAAIFTEPSNLKEIEHGHRGNLFLKATVNGDSGHASSPEKIKVHSVRQMIIFADALKSEFVKWQKEFAGTEFTPPTVGEITSIQAGVAIKNGEIIVESPNKFPSVCTATFDVRTTPDFHKVAFERISKLGKKMGISINYAFPPAPAGYTDLSEKIVKIAQRVIKNSKFTVSKGSADLGFLAEIGVKSIIFGPGEKDQCHKVNEFCYPAQIPEAVKIYKQIIEAWA